MENQNNNHQFKEDEIAYIRRWDKDRNEYISNPYPKIGGRLRLAHEHNETLSIETEIVRYDEQIAVVSAVATTVIGCFKGIGMASVQRDEKIAPAILELAETRAIARALRFAGYGVEYCSAEEVSHLENGNHDKVPKRGIQHHKSENPPAGGNGNNSNQPANGNGRLTGKQYRYMLQLNENQGSTKADLDKQCLEMFGTVAQHLSKADASSVIENLLPR